MDLYNSIIVTIWLTMLYAVWAATAAGDPGYGQAAFIISGIAGHLYLRKLKLERPVREEEDIDIPNAEFSVEILEEKDKYVISEKAFRKIIWISTILSLIFSKPKWSLSKVFCAFAKSISTSLFLCQGSSVIQSK